MMINMLSYKCKLHGINMVLVNEAYTSKCSFLDNERICKHEKYQGRRIRRGMFRSNTGILINADINGAFNIMRKGLGKSNCDALNLVPTNKRFVYNPVRIKVA